MRELCRRYGVTAFMALLASFGTVLSRLSGQANMVVGVPITGRTDARTENLIGFFVNTLPLHVDLAGDPIFGDLLERVRDAAVSGYAHADAALDLLVGELPAARVPGRTPLFQVILNVVDTPPDVDPLPGLSAELLDSPARPSKFDLTLTAREWHGVLQLELEFNADRYEWVMIETLLGDVSALLRAATLDPTKRISEYSLRENPEEIPDIPSVDAPMALPHRAIERFGQDPDRVAVIDRDGKWSYQYVNDAADRVARALTQRFPANVDIHLGVVWRANATFVAAILGCLKAGLAFSVIDAAASTTPLPGISAVVDASPGGGGPPATIDLHAILSVEAGPVRVSPEPSAEAPAPGRDWALEKYGFRDQDRFAVLSRLPGHLLSALSSAFTAGATLVMSDHSFTDDPGALLTWLRDTSVSVAYVTPSILRALTAQSLPLPALRHVFVDNSGDFIAQDIEALRRAWTTCRCVSIYRVGQDGRPLAAHAVPDDWTLDSAPLRVPLGIVLHDDALLRHPSGRAAAAGEVVEICLGTYRTGDLARRWPDGTIEFVSRLGTDLTADPLEATGALRALPGVHDAVVADQPDANGRLVSVGYVAAPDETLDVADVHRLLVNRLPDNLIPHHVVVLDRLPRTGAGDYDLSALPDPGAESTPLDGYLAPRTPLERQVTSILQELLGVDRVGVHDSFFELGGFSLLATQLSSRIRGAIQVELTLRDIFESATVEILAQRILRTQAAQAEAADVEALLDELESAESARR